MVARVAKREAEDVSGDTTTSASDLRACPLCGSAAIESVAADAYDDGLIRLRILCHECDTWRAVLVAPVRASVLLLRLSRMLERDRDEIAEALRAIELDEIDPSALCVSRPPPPGLFS